MANRKTVTPVAFERVRALALALPGVEEGTSYGTPAFRVSKKLFARLHQDGAALVLWMEPDARELLMQRDPETYFVTDHYEGHSWVLVRLASADENELAELLDAAWTQRASGLLQRARGSS